MKLNMVALCDRATVREGLLHILGAGVTQCSLQLPSTPDLDCALLIQAEEAHELAGQHTLRATLMHGEADRLGVVELLWDAPHVDPKTDPAVPQQPLPQLPVVVPLRGVILSQDGEYRVEIEIDSTKMAEAHFTVTKAEIPGVTLQVR